MSESFVERECKTQPEGSREPRVELVWPGKYGPAGERRRPARTILCDWSPPVSEVARTGPQELPGGFGLRVIERFDNTAAAAADYGHCSPTGRLIRGDFRAVLPMLDDGQVDFIYVDPPFNSDRDRKVKLADGAPATPNHATGFPDRWKTPAYLDFLDDLLQLSRPKLRRTGVIAVHTDHRASAFVRCLLDEHFDPSRYVNELIWKYGLGNARARRHFLRKHDTIAVYARSSDHYFNVVRGPITKAQADKYRHRDDNGRYMLSYGRKYYLKGGKPLESVLEVPSLSATSRERCGYPTQKPGRLLSLLIEALCPPGGLVLDPCCGSGTTLVAAQTGGRRWIGIEIEPLAVDLARERLATMPQPDFVVESSQGGEGRSGVIHQRRADDACPVEP